MRCRAGLPGVPEKEVRSCSLPSVFCWPDSCAARRSPVRWPCLCPARCSVWRFWPRYSSCVPRCSIKCPRPHASSCRICRCSSFPPVSGLSPAWTFCRRTVRPSRRFSWPARSWPTLRPTPFRRGSDTTLWPTLADCRPDGSDRHHGRRHRDTADECHAHPRLARAGMRCWQRMTAIRDANAAFEVIA